MFYRDPGVLFHEQLVGLGPELRPSRLPVHHPDGDRLRYRRGRNWRGGHDLFNFNFNLLSDDLLNFNFHFYGDHLLDLHFYGDHLLDFNHLRCRSGTALSGYQCHQNQHCN